MFNFCDYINSKRNKCLTSVFIQSCKYLVLIANFYVHSHFFSKSGKVISKVSPVTTKLRICPSNISVESTKNMAGFFAHRIYNSVRGWGTNDSHLIRIIVSRSEVTRVAMQMFILMLATFHVDIDKI